MRHVLLDSCDASHTTSVKEFTDEPKLAADNVSTAATHHLLRCSEKKCQPIDVPPLGIQLSSLFRWRRNK